MSETSENRMRAWRDEATGLSRSIRTMAVYGPVVLSAEVARRVAEVLMEAEPPGNGLSMLRQGVQAARDDATPFLPSSIQEGALPEPPPAPMEAPGAA